MALLKPEKFFVTIPRDNEFMITSKSLLDWLIKLELQFLKNPELASDVLAEMQLLLIDAEKNYRGSI